VGFRVYCTWTHCIDGNFPTEDEPMTTLTYSKRHTNKIDDATFDARQGPNMAVSVALYYPSLAGNCWDDELLPSGD
jgi:hypothetical protein